MIYSLRQTVRIEHCRILRQSTSGLAFLIEHPWKRLDVLVSAGSSWFPVRHVSTPSGLPPPFVGYVGPILTQEWLAIDKDAPYVPEGEAGDVVVKPEAPEAPEVRGTVPDGEAEAQACEERLAESERQRRHAELEAGPSASAAARFVRDTSKYIADEDLLADDAEEG